MKLKPTWSLLFQPIDDNTAFWNVTHYDGKNSFTYHQSSHFGSHEPMFSIAKSFILELLSSSEITSKTAEHLLQELEILAENGPIDFSSSMQESLELIEQFADLFGSSFIEVE